MKAAEGVLLYRTDGNTDPLLVVLRAETETDVFTLVPDDATVEMDLKIAAGNVGITATARGDDSGTFLFPVISIPAGKSKIKFDIDVTTVAGKATYARGTITTAEKIEE